MQIRIITVEREYGSGGALIARRLAEKLGWKLWDQELTAEIARIAKVDHKAARRCDERVDPLVYRLFKVFARGSYERALPVEGSASGFDTDQMDRVLRGASWNTNRAAPTTWKRWPVGVVGYAATGAARAGSVSPPGC